MKSSVATNRMIAVLVAVGLAAVLALGVGQGPASAAPAVKPWSANGAVCFDHGSAGEDAIDGVSAGTDPASASGGAATAYTGVAVVSIGALGLALLLGGVALTLAARRRRHL